MLPVAPPHPNPNSNPNPHGGVLGVAPSGSTSHCRHARDSLSGTAGHAMPPSHFKAHNGVRDLDGTERPVNADEHAEEVALPPASGQNTPTWGPRTARLVVGQHEGQLWPTLLIRLSHLPMPGACHRPGLCYWLSLCVCMCARMRACARVCCQDHCPSCSSLNVLLCIDVSLKIPRYAIPRYA